MQEFSTVPKESVLKVSCVEGDIEKEGLGLSNEHREILLTSHISVVFHIAASVRLRDSLDVAMKTNALPVIDMVRLCEELPEIKVKKTRSVNAPNLWRTYTFLMSAVLRTYLFLTHIYLRINLLQPTGYVTHQPV